MTNGKAPDEQAAVKRLTGQAKRIAEVFEKVGGIVKAAALLNASRTTLHKWQKGEARLPFDETAVLADAAGVSLEWIASGRESFSRTDLIWLQRFEVSPDGSVREVTAPHWHQVPFWRPFLEAHGANTQAAIAILIDGRQMAPTIAQGSIVAVDRSINDLLTPGVYALVQGKRLVLTRVEPRFGGSVVLTADSRPGQSETLSGTDTASLVVIGKVVVTLSEP